VSGGPGLSIFGTAACGATYSTSISVCYTYVAGGVRSCGTTGNGGPALERCRSQPVVVADRKG